jgi:uncharacterized protein with PIN domain
VFQPNYQLKPDLKQKGFVMNKFLSRVGGYIRNKGYNVKIIETDDFQVVFNSAQREGRILLTNHFKNYKQCNEIPAGCLDFKAGPFDQIKAVEEYFKL